MNVVDSSGWLEYFGDGKNARFFARPIQDIENLIVPTICIYEVFKRLLSLRDKEEALRAIGVMSLGQLIELDRQLALNAARFSLDLKLALADSIILATARANEAILWTQDEHFKGLEDVKYVAKKA
jgi:predicted nucleic acid-binding protein